MGLLLPAAVEDSPSLIEAGLADMVAAGDEGEPDVTVSNLLYQLQSRRSRPKSARFHQKVNLDRYFVALKVMAARLRRIGCWRDFRPHTRRDRGIPTWRQVAGVG